MENLNTISLHKAEKDLIRFVNDKNITEDIRYFIEDWELTPANDIINIKEQFSILFAHTKNAFFQEKSPKNIEEILEYVLFNMTYDKVMSKLKQNFTSADSIFYKTCKYFVTNKVTPEQLGGTVYFSIPTSAVVELSLLENKRSPQEKVNCLCSTYDLIFAELKRAIISHLADISEKDCDIPIVNNKDVTPVLMAVIIRSRLFYFVSNLNYIKLFGDEILSKNKDIRKIVDIFEDSLKNILDMRKTFSTRNTWEKSLTNMSVCEAMQFIENVETDNSENSLSSREKRRIASLITLSTTEEL